MEAAKVFRCSQSQFKRMKADNPDLMQLLLLHMLEIPRKIDGRVKMAVFDCKDYDEEYFGKFKEEYEEMGVQIEFFKTPLDEQTSRLADGSKAKSGLTFADCQYFH